MMLGHPGNRIVPRIERALQMNPTEDAGAR